MILDKAPLGSAMKSRFLDRRPIASPLTSAKDTRYKPHEKCLIAGFSLCYTAGELTKEKQSSELMRKIVELTHKKFGANNIRTLEVEINSTIHRLTDRYYDGGISHTAIGLYLVLNYLNNTNEMEQINNRSIKNRVKKQLDYFKRWVKDKKNEKVLRNSQLMSENIIKLLKHNGLQETSKTAEEIAEALKTKAYARRVTDFSFNGEKYEVKGEHLTLEQCIERFCEKRYQTDFKTFKSREFFMKKYKVKLELL